MLKNMLLQDDMVRYCFAERDAEGRMLCAECELVWEANEEFSCMRISAPKVQHLELPVHYKLPMIGINVLVSRYTI